MLQMQQPMLGIETVVNFPEPGIMEYKVKVRVFLLVRPAVTFPPPLHPLSPSCTPPPHSVVCSTGAQLALHPSRVHLPARQVTVNVDPKLTLRDLTVSVPTPPGVTDPGFKTTSGKLALVTDVWRVRWTIGTMSGGRSCSAVFRVTLAQGVVRPAAWISFPFSLARCTPMHHTELLLFLELYLYLEHCLCLVHQLYLVHLLFLEH